MSKMVSTTIYPTKEQWDALKALHEKTQVPISVYVRNGIDYILKAHEDKLNEQEAEVRDMDTSGR